MYRRILLALDDEGRPEAAWAIVGVLARRSLAHVVVVSVSDATTGPEPAGAVGGAVARLESEGVSAGAEVLPTNGLSVAATIVAAARRLRSDLVVLGSSGRGNLAGLLLGGVNHRVCAHLDCAVLFVRARGPADRPEALRRLFVAVDDSEEALDAVATAGALAREHGSSVLVAHALDDRAVDRDGYAAVQRSGRAVLDRAVRQLDATGSRVEARLVTGARTAAAGLAAEADRWDADLVVIGSRRLTDLGGLILGSVAYELVRRSCRPVLLAPRLRATAPRRQGPSALGERLSRA